MNCRSVEVHTSQGSFLVSVLNRELVCQGKLPDGTHEFEELTDLPEESQLLVLRATGACVVVPFGPRTHVFNGMEYTPVDKGARPRRTTANFLEPAWAT